MILVSPFEINLGQGIIGPDQSLTNTRLWPEMAKHLAQSRSEWSAASAGLDFSGLTFSQIS